MVEPGRLTARPAGLGEGVSAHGWGALLLADVERRGVGARVGLDSSAVGTCVERGRRTIRDGLRLIGAAGAADDHDDREGDAGDDAGGTGAERHGRAFREEPS